MTVETPPAQGMMANRALLRVAPFTADAISIWRRILFTTPAFPLASMLVPILLYLPDYYARELGMNLTVLAGVLMFVRLFDVWFDPAVGIVMDKTKTRFGRFRPWFVAGVPLGMAAMYMLYNAPVGVTAAYLLFWLVAVNVGQSMSHLSHLAWTAAIWNNYDERSNTYGWLTIFSTIGFLTIMAFPPLMVHLFGTKQADSVSSMGWLIIVALPLTMLFALSSVGEAPPVDKRHERPRLQDYLRLAKRPSVLRLMVVDMLWGIGPTVAGTLFFAFFDALKLIPREISGFILLMYFVAGLVCAPLWMKLSHRMGKHNALVVASLVYAVLQGSLLLLPAGAPWVAAIAMFVAGIPSSAGPILIASMTADAADDVRLDSGLDRTALLFGLRNGLSKIGTSVAVGLTLYVVGAAGYDFKHGHNNVAGALTVLACLYAFVPVAMGLTAAWIIRGHKLDAAAHAAIRRALEERDREAGMVGP